MSSLADIIGRAIEQHRGEDGSIPLHDAVETALPQARADDDACSTLLREALYKRIKDASTGAKRAAERKDDRQHEFWGDKLQRRYVIDTNARFVKETDELTLIEFDRVIEIRERGIAADQAALSVLHEARDALAPMWREMSHLRFGQVMALYFAQRRAAE